MRATLALNGLIIIDIELPGQFSATEEISRSSWNNITRELSLFFRNSGFNELISVDERQEIVLAILNFKGQL